MGSVNSDNAIKKLELQQSERKKLICYLKRGIYRSFCEKGLITALQLSELEAIVEKELNDIKEDI